MSLVIFVEKIRVASQPDLSAKLLSFCESVVEDHNSVILIPLDGKLIPALTILVKHGIQYELKDFSQAVLKSDVAKSKFAEILVTES